jgi:adenosylcobinamide-phosphate synthase
MSLSTLVLGAGLVLDAVVGEPPQRLHPVAWFGRLVAPVDRTWARPRPVGILVALCLPVGAGLVVAGSILAASAVSWLAGAALGAVWLFVSTSLRRLLVRVRDVVVTTETDPDTARERLRALAGRDATALSPGQVRSAAIESLAENLADGLVSPLLAFTVAAVAVTGLGVGESALFGAESVVAVAAGCGTAAWVKAVNTLDSMLGYYSTPTGWGPARLDDAVQYLPARVSVLLLAGVCLQPRAVLTARDWQTEVSSPNSGWPMGTLAAALDVRLEKPDHYVLNPEGTLPDVTTAAVAIRNVGVAGILAYALAGVVTWL